MIYIGIDDTDNAEGGGTGRVARGLAADLADVGAVTGVTRHQLLVDDRVPYTRNNSCNVIHLQASALTLDALAERLAAALVERCLPGSDPGLCVTSAEPLARLEFGRQAQTLLVTQTAALALAEKRGIWLRPLGGTGDGVIGALAGVILAATGEDGRFVDLGGIRALAGRASIREVLAAGVTDVCEPDGARVAAGWVENAQHARPDVCGGRAVLKVEPVAPGVWRVPERHAERGARREHG
jgi:hypothetical protein